MQGTASCRFCGELWVQLRGCKGRSPLHKKTKSLPLPAGKGAGGMGATKTTNGRDSRRQRRQAPLQIPEWHGQPATSRASPPPGEWFALAPGAAWVQPRGCKGRSPLHKKTKSLPLPAGKSALRARVGGMGATKQAKGRDSRRQRRQATPADTTAARSAGDQSGKPPASDIATAGRAGNEKTPPSPQKKPVSLLTGFPPSCIFMYNYNEKGGSMARIPPPDTRFEQFVKIRICIDNHVTVCYNSDTAEEPRRNAP